MKKFLTILILLSSVGLSAQTYNNEWIDYHKTYYKFKVGATGVYRIPQSVLASAGLGSTTAQNFQLFRNGVEIPIYTSVASGTLGASDYIEFWGEMNDGVPDNPLYRRPAFQHTKKWSLQTDTAVFFLTVNPAVTNFRCKAMSNDTTGNVLPVEPYFSYTSGNYFKYTINPGAAGVVGVYVYSSSYDSGEFWSSPFISSTAFGYPASTTNVNNLFVYPGGPDGTISFGLAGCADNSRTIQLKVNNTILKDTQMDSFNDLLSSAPLPTSLINSGTATVVLQNNSPTSSDRMVASYFELNYPRQFNFGGAANFPFQLPARNNGYYLKISNFSNGSAAPVLYDLSNGARYVAVTDISGNFTFLLPPSSNAMKLVLVSEDASNIRTVTSLTTKNFVDITSGANQGNFLIISNPFLYTGTHGNNPVFDYRDYRKTSAGGGFNAQAYDINELVDQFAFGIKKHPLAIKNFMRYARAKFSIKPEYVFLIGHGMTYDQYRKYENGLNVELLNMVPTFGYPASDNMLTSDDGMTAVPATPVGRLSVVFGSEIEDYLAKVTEYNNVQQTAPNTAEGRAWMKNVIHVTGATDVSLGTVLCNYMDGYRQVIEDTFYGAKVTTFCKSSADAIETISIQRMSQLFSEGFSMLNYFGHSSANVLEFNLDDPNQYNNAGKYPVFYVNGCDAGNFFVYDQARFANNKTLSETYVLAKQRGSIAFVASTHFGVVNYLNVLINGLYDDITRADYGKSLGIIQQDAVHSLVNIAPNDYYARLHAEEMTLNGDPALKLNGEALPDYDIESSLVKLNPSFVSLTNNNFTVNVHMLNLGKAVHDSITVEIKRQLPDGSIIPLYKKKIPGILSEDSILLTVPIVPSRDKGQNYILISLNTENSVQEVTLANNNLSLGLFIYEDEATPVYPYDYSIINTSTQKLYASTANPFSASRQYVLEMDTTKLYNSPSKITKNLTSVGGLLEFDPGITFKDSTVYYWHVAQVPATNDPYHWNEASFIYLSAGGPGYNQSHYFQHLGSAADSVSMTSNRSWSFGTHMDNLYMRNTVYPEGGTADVDFSVSVNNNAFIQSACVGRSLIFNVFDPVTFKAWKNVDASGNNLFLSGSGSANCAPSRNWNIEFSYMTAASRNKMVRFMDSIPNGYYVTVRNIPMDYQAGNTYASDWQADTAVYGSGNSLYHRLLNAGFTGIDSMYRPRAFCFVYKKNDNNFSPQYKVSAGIYDKVILPVDCPAPDTSGTILSPRFGPAKKWKQLHWRGSSLEAPSTDETKLEIIGTDTLNNSTTLFTLDAGTPDFDISSIDPKLYPLLRLKLTAADTVNLTPYQLKYWRLDYDPVPEGAVAPNIFLTVKDTLSLGEKMHFAVAFKNVSPTSFDSMRINITILDHSNVTHVIQMPKKRPIISGDTLIVALDIDAKDYVGTNTLFVDVNPANDQPEQFHFNNFLYKNFYVRPDNTNPLLDVTFDNVHILNNDIVSAKPHIQVKLKDESKFNLLTDTSLMTVQVRFPDGTMHSYNFNTDTLKFTPAANASDNTASIDFYPAFTKQFNPEGDNYVLIVTGKDGSGNKAGKNGQYQIGFTIITKPMISNMLNYPNPFTTSTAFVFTITGSDVPQNIKIQVLTITGKIVREITKDELGPLHIGRNITEFKWDGTDMFGQRLANGVYLYHVVTNLNGKLLDKYKAADDNTDQYFIKGYGKMYLMR